MLGKLKFLKMLGFWSSSPILENDQIKWKKVPKIVWNFFTPSPSLEKVQTQGEKYLNKLEFEWDPPCIKNTKAKILKQFGIG